MKISEMINNLSAFMVRHGDIECWYAVDDEGNGYQEIYFEPTLYYVDADKEVYGCVEDFEDCDLTEEDVTPICVVN